MSEIPELTARDFKRMIRASHRRRLIAGKFESGEDVAALRRFVGLTQTQFSRALGISVHTLRNWEQGRRHPEGPALALLRIAARHPKIVRENAAAAARGRPTMNGHRARASRESPRWRAALAGQ